MAHLIGIFVFSLILGSMADSTPDLVDFFSNVDNPTRVVGGTTAAEGSHPHMVALTTGLLFQAYFCGGSIIATRTVLTAAHCIDVAYNSGSLSRTLRVNVGSTEWSQSKQSYSVMGNVTHYRWTPNIVKNDIGILHTASAIVYNEIVKPIPVSYEYVDGEIPARSAGWGRTSVYGPISSQLLELTVTTISSEQCANDVEQANADLHLQAPPYEPSIELCTFHSQGQGMCRGDSGGALFRLDQGTQVGVISWGFPCARGAPDIFVRISAYEAWIQKNTRL